jgi:hypothetical protein
MSPDQAENKLPAGQEEAPKPARSQKKASTNWLPILGNYMLEIISPAILSMALLAWLSVRLNIWTLDRTLALLLFGVALIILSFALVLLLDMFNFATRRKPQTSSTRLLLGSRSRIIKFFLGGILLPSAVFTAAYLVVLPVGETGISLLIQASAAQIKSSPQNQISAAILATKNPTTKIFGIQALQSIHSGDALIELIHLLNEDPASLSDAGVSSALSKAIASFGIDAKKTLLDTFNKVGLDQRNGVSVSSEDLYGQYFSQSFTALRSDITAQASEQNNSEIKTQIDAAESNLKNALQKLQAQNTEGETGYFQLEFVMKTILLMEIKEDAELLKFAHTVVSDSSYPVNIRGESLLLIAKLGNNNDFNALYAYLQSDQNLLQAKALEAIYLLQNKMKGVTITQ